MTAINPKALWKDHLEALSEAEEKAKRNREKAEMLQQTVANAQKAGATRRSRQAALKAARDKKRMEAEALRRQEQAERERARSSKYHGD